MAKVLILVPAAISKDTVDCLLSLLEDARAGEVVGLTYVALHRGRRFTADVIGESKTHPVYTLGTIHCLTTYLEGLAGPK